MRFEKRAALAGLALASFIPGALLAHRQWMLPSSTILSKSDSWITVDAAVSNELFYFDHVPMRVAGVVITGPDGAAVQPQNVATGKYRSTFDVHLAQPGTYRIASVSNMVFAAWTEKGEAKNWRGDASAFTREVPAGAEGLKTARMSNRVEVFATAGKPDSKALQPTGVGLELVPVTHPNDLVTGEKATFQFVHNGKPAAGIEVTVIPGGIRYRDQLKEQKIATDAGGKFSVTFAEPGMYWMNATVGAAPRGAGGPGGPGGAGGKGGPRAMMMPAGDRASYVATLEVLPQ
ncbi:MAG: DUF4198 domain-containing protein [Bryobacterales bacterium]|nr:DUF4198 domain-containing protein [Bryobacterales bacterium]